MIREWSTPAKMFAGICVLAASSFAQSYTISAKPGAVNFIEGDVSINGDPVWTSNLRSTFLSANDVIGVKNGKAEVLLTPGVFLRLGRNSEVRMVRASLVETQVEIVSGESMIEVDDITPGSSVVVLDHGSSTMLIKAGLYKFTESSIATLEGKAAVTFGDRNLDLKKNKEVAIDDSLHAGKIDLAQGDDLYAWSNTRAQYNAAATYAGARDVYNNSSSGYSSSFSSPGWYWNSPYNSFMWMPGNGAFYSPFGWGFYGPGVVAYAPVVLLPYYGVRQNGGGVSGITTAKPTMYVPVNPGHVGVPTFNGSSPASFSAARSMMQQTVSSAGLRTATGAPAASLQPGRTFSSMQAASNAAASSSRTASSSGGGYGGGGARGGVSGPSSSSSAGARSSAPAGGGHNAK